MRMQNMAVIYQLSKKKHHLIQYVKQIPDYQRKHPQGIRVIWQAIFSSFVGKINVQLSEKKKPNAKNKLLTEKLLNVFVLNACE